ncbi:zinc-binding dehydrogenase [Flavobacterium bizetiae]|uniref:zinc-binding dehydrogenase n=1 Tax=Flavobacterium bizetiae TaxID=2704140 RepID=UPI0018D62FC4|nr:zinc-binding dehydrogenase [Flavobacterium bizetiae]
MGSKATFEAMNRAIEINNIQPIVDKVYLLEQIKEAFHYLDQGGHFGKVVITF